MYPASRTCWRKPLVYKCIFSKKIFVKHFFKLDVLEEDGPEEGVSRELAELGRRAEQLAHQLRNLRYRKLVCRKIKLIESSTKCRHLKKFTCKGTLRQVFICLRPPSLLGFCLGWSSNFVGSPPPALPATHCLYILYFDKGKGGRGEGGLRWTREKVRGAIVHKAGSKIPTWLTVSPFYKL